MLADSITLTPGTITVSLEGNEYVVHCLDKELAEGINTSVFVTLLKRLERME
jgi:multicomponent Na+:H+ antiporter subunit E